jgi:hypothetical protein
MADGQLAAGVEFADKAINTFELNDEIEALNLPGFIGSGRFSRRRNDAGQLYSSPAYVLIKCGTLTSAQLAALTTVVDNHTPSA